MPLIYTNQSDGLNISSTETVIFTYTMPADGRVGVSLWIENLSSGTANLSVYLEALNGSDQSFGRFVEAIAKPTGPTRLRLEFEGPIFMRSGYKIRVGISSSVNMSVVDFTWYVFDPNHASDLAALEGQSLGSKVGDNFNVLFQNAGNNSTKVLADLATPALVNTDTLIDGKTIVEALKIISAVLAGKVSGAGTGSEVFRSLDDTANRVSVTVDAEGNRTAVTY